MFKKSTALLLVLALALSLCSCALPPMPLPGRSSPAPAESRDWKEYYSEVISGYAIPAGLPEFLEQHKLPGSILAFKSYFLCDWDNCGTPELFLQSIQKRYCFVLSNDGGVIIGNVYGVDFKNHVLVIHGHNDGSVGTELNEWKFMLPENDDSIWIDAEFTDDAVLYSGYAPTFGTDFKNNPSAEAEEIYSKLFLRYVPVAEPMDGFTAYPLSDVSGLEDIQSGSTELTKQKANALSAFSGFIAGREYLNMELVFADDVPTTKYFFDFEGDGIPELIMTNGSSDPARISSYVFRYDGQRIKNIGIGPVNGHICLNLPGVLWNKQQKEWRYYRLFRNGFTEKQPENGDEYLPDETDAVAYVKGYPLIPITGAECREAFLLSLVYYRA